MNPSANNYQNATQLSSTQDRQPPLLCVRIGRYGGRLLAIAGLAWVCWYGATSLSDVISGPEQPVGALADPSSTKIPSLPQLFLSHVQEGYWQAGDASVDIRFALLSSDKVGAVVFRPPPTSPLRSGADAGKEILDLVKLYRLAPRMLGDQQAYILDQPTVKAAVFTRRVQGQEHVVVGRLAIPSPQHGWLLLETNRLKARKAGSDSARPFLLPVPEDAKRLGTRKGKEDTVIGELVRVPASFAQLKQLWGKNGWVIQQPGTFDFEPGVLCRRGEDTVYVWSGSANARLGGELTLFFLRIPKPGGSHE